MDPVKTRERAERVASRLHELPALERRIIALLKSREDRRVTRMELAKAMGCSAFHVDALFRRTTGLTTYEFGTFLRMTRAADEIRKGTKVEAVAAMVGYRSRKNFYRRFTAWFGMTPSDFRRTRRRSTPGRF